MIPPCLKFAKAVNEVAVAVSASHRYKNTYKQSLCLEMLERGFHRSFAEIFGLIKQQADRRLAAGPDSSLWSQCPLTEEPEKLDVMRNHLVEAESAMLLGNRLDCVLDYVFVGFIYCEFWLT